MVKKCNINAVPPLKSIYLNPTGYCNLKCRHCWTSPDFSPKGKPARDMDVRLFKKIIRDAKKLGLGSIKLTGGEPLLYRDLYELAKFATGEGLAVSIETNGTLVDKFSARLLSKAGVKFISVSLDSTSAPIHDEFRGVVKSFDRALEGAKALINQGISTQIIFALFRKNRSELFNMPRLAKSIGASSLKINVIQSIARAETMKREGDLLDVRENIEAFKGFEKKFQEYLFPIIYDIPIVFKNTESLKNKINITKCSVHNLLGVLPDGTASLCGIGFTTKDMILGDLARDPVEKIWNENPFLKKLRRDIPQNLKGICGICMFKNFCLGKCVAHTFHDTGKHYLSFGFCEEAGKLGLFPQSRKISFEQPEPRRQKRKPVKASYRSGL